MRSFLNNLKCINSYLSKFPVLFLVDNVFDFRRWPLWKLPTIVQAVQAQHTNSMCVKEKIS